MCFTSKQLTCFLLTAHFHSKHWHFLHVYMPYAQDIEKQDVFVKHFAPNRHFDLRPWRMTLTPDMLKRRAKKLWRRKGFVFKIQCPGSGWGSLPYTTKLRRKWIQSDSSLQYYNNCDDIGNGYTVTCLLSIIPLQNKAYFFFYCTNIYKCSSPAMCTPK